jgi:hypothetical protein
VHRVLLVQPVQQVHQAPRAFKELKDRREPRVQPVHKALLVHKARKEFKGLQVYKAY